jgi:hypothetical protein
LLEGRVTEEGSGKPVAGARLIVTTERGLTIVEARTDKAGRYAIRPFPSKFPGARFEVITHPPEGSPYLIIRQWSAMADKDRQELNVSLPVGVVVRGRVTQAGSGKAVAGARVQYRQRNADNPLLRKGAAKLPFVNTLFLEEGDGFPVSTLEAAITNADGRFQLAVAPGPGHLFVLGPTLDYVPVETTLRELEGGKPGAFRYYPHAIVPLNLKPGAEVPEVAATLRRGVTLRGRIIGPDCKPVAKFIVLCRSYIPSGWHQWNNTSVNWLEGRDGRFDLPGCDPDKAVTAYFWDANNGLGATAELSAQPAASEGTTVSLEPCGKADVRCVDLDGKPLAGYGNVFSFQFDAGTCEPLYAKCADRPLEGNWFNWGWYQADADGRVMLTNLIPGATYFLVSLGMKQGQERRTQDFTVKSGRTTKVLVVDEVANQKPSQFVDLQPKANQKLKETFDESLDGNNLADLEQGIRPLRKGIFHIGEGLIRLASKNLKDTLPEKVEGIKVDAKFTNLWILHATAHSVADDTVVAKHVVHYADKSAETIEVTYGKDVRDWWRHNGDKEPTRGKVAWVAWEGTNEAAKAAGSSIWLFHLTWKNPHPGKKVDSIDFVSTLTEAAPFVVAMTWLDR